ncbi:zinc finger family protein [Musa troglodytarum]|uniref:Zinc finger family protein n=1 Tax=Musa troglodytarum TaxID=320322 RepID=A0A9E7GML4_9LILI|nr:zinc finger family protein [Musa troglodytarum]
MDRAANLNGHEHVIDISQHNDASASVSARNDHGDSDGAYNEDRPSTSTLAPVSQLTPTSPNISNSINFSLPRRADNYGRRNRSPLNSGLWISVELVVNVSQIIAAIIVLSFSRHERPRTPLFAWIIGYTTGCFATLPHLYWRYIHRNSLVSEQEPALSGQGTSRNSPPESSAYADISVTQDPEQENGHNSVPETRQTTITSQRIHSIVDHFKMALDFFFAVWFVVGNVWVFGGHSSSHDAPNLYRLCIVFLAFSCIGEDINHGRGASQESINALPTYKFKTKRRKNRGDKEINLDNQGNGGILAAGTDKERIVSAEDAVCCICLAKYVDNEELRELPCTHFFHKECVDKWLKINALCPLCKTETQLFGSEKSVQASRYANNIYAPRLALAGLDLMALEGDCSVCERQRATTGITDADASKHSAGSVLASRQGDMVGGGSRRDDGPLKISSTNVFAALETLKKKKKSDKLSKSKGPSKSQAKEPEQQVFWAPTPLTVKSWADVDDDDDDYYATTAPPQAVWGLSEQQPKKEVVAAVEEESESEDDGLDIGDDDVEEEPEHEPEVAVATEPIIEKPASVSVPSKDAERQLSKKELKKKEMEELDALLHELGISSKDSYAAQDEINDKKQPEQSGGGEKQENSGAPLESKSSKKKKAKKEKSSKDTKEYVEQPADLNNNNNSPDEVVAEPEEEDASAVDVKERIKKVASMKKKKSSKEMDAAAKAAAIEAAARSARLAAAKKKEKSHYNQQPAR